MSGLFGSFLQKASRVEFNWTIPLYGHGFYIKKWLNWPRWLPLPAYISHGVNSSPYFAPHEQSNGYLVNLYYSDDKVLWQIKSPFKLFIQIPHPYLFLHKDSFVLPSSDRKGLLVFWPHTTGYIQYHDSYVDRYLDFLNSIRYTFDKVDICIASNDLEQPWVKRLSDYFNVVTAGSSLHREFPQRLFTLIDSYEYATSPCGGSELFYCHVMGVRYFIEGPQPPYYNSGDSNISLGLYTTESYSGLHKLEELYKASLFSRANLDNYHMEKSFFVKKHTGFNCRVNRLFLVSCLILDFPRQLILWLFKRYSF